MQNPFSKAIPLLTGDSGDLATVNVYTDFVDEFIAERPAPGTKVILKINADSEFAVWINGRFALTGQHSQFPYCPCVEYADITPLVKAGRNTVAVAVYRQGHTTSTYIAGQGQLIFEITEHFADIDGEFVVGGSSEDTLWRISPSYKSGPVPQVSGQLGFTFAYAPVKGANDFIGEDYTKEKAKEDGFTAALPLGEFEALEYTVRNIEKLRILPAKSCEIVAQGVFDFGGEYRKTNSNPHAFYMQNAALKSRYLGQMLDGAPRITKEIPQPENYMAEPCSPLPPAEGSMRLKAGDIKLTGELREGRGVYAVFDIGEETLGYLSFRFTLTRQAVVGIAYSDHLEDLRARSYVGGRCFAETLILPSGETAHTHLLSKIGARYLMIFAETDEITVSSIGILPAVYPVAEKRLGGFEINDCLHGKIYSTCVRTLLLCMNEHYMDCPQREQALYAMDSRNQMLCGYYAFGEYKYARESLSLLARSLRPDGLFELCSPAKVAITIPSFSTHWVIALCEYTKFSGDVDFFYEQLKTANTVMSAFMSRRSARGVLLKWTEKEYWSFHEWNGELSGAIGCASAADADACLTALFMIATTKLADILEETGGTSLEMTNQVERLRKLVASMRKAFNETFFDGEKGVYCSFRDIAGDDSLRNYSEYTNALAILSGAASENSVYLDSALRSITGRNENVEVSPCTLSTCLFKYDALMSVSKDNIGLVMDEITELWGYMISRGATSFWETIKGAEDFDDAGSLCHGWSAIPAVVYYRYILGIEPVKCGFERYSVKPAFWNNHFARGSVYLPAKKAVLTVHVDGSSFYSEEKE